MKINKWQILLACAVVGGGSLSAIAQLDMLPVFKSYLLMLPLQAAALMYVFLWYRNRRTPDLDRRR
jgi:hypothetical protein